MEWENEMQDLSDALEHSPLPELPDAPVQMPPDSPLLPEAPFPPAEPEPPQSPFQADYERMMALPPIPKQEAEACRHRLEKRWYRRLIEVNILLIVFVLAMIVSSVDSYIDKMTELTEHIAADVMETLSGEEDADGAEADDEAEEDDYYTDFAEDFPFELQLLGYGLILLISGLIGLYTLQASVKASSIKITKNNFPELYQLIFSYAQRLGMEQVPEAYIVQQNGVLNASSAFIIGRSYIQINSEVFEVAYREHHDLNALSFVVAHELAHIYYRHATFSYNLPIWFSMNVPIISSIASRTREYSCDRLAQRLTNYDGIDAMLMLMVDRHLYKMVDKQDYFDQTAQEGGFFLWLTNLLSTHPIMPKRLRALALWEGSGELY